MRYFLRRLGFYLFTLWGAITLNFFMPRLIPGNPAEAFLVRMQGQVQDPRILNALMIDFGVNTKEPLWQQYLDYLNNLLHGNLGLSISHFPTPVSEVVAQCLPWTIALVGVSTIISFILGITLGIVFAWKRGSWLDQGSNASRSFLCSIALFLGCSGDPLFPGFSAWLVPSAGWLRYQSHRWPILGFFLKRHLLLIVTCYLYRALFLCRLGARYAQFNDPELKRGLYRDGRGERSSRGTGDVFLCCA